MGGIWNSLEVQARENVECGKQNLAGDSGDQNTDSNEDITEYAREVLDGTRHSIGNCTRGYSAKEVVYILSIPETL